MARSASVSEDETHALLSAMRDISAMQTGATNEERGKRLDKRLAKLRGTPKEDSEWDRIQRIVEYVPFAYFLVFWIFVALYMVIQHGLTDNESDTTVTRFDAAQCSNTTLGALLTEAHASLMHSTTTNGFASTQTFKGITVRGLLTWIVTPLLIVAITGVVTYALPLIIRFVYYCKNKTHRPPFSQVQLIISLIIDGMLAFLIVMAAICALIFSIEVETNFDTDFKCNGKLLFTTSFSESRASRFMHDSMLIVGGMMLYSAIGVVVWMVWIVHYRFLLHQRSNDVKKSAESDADETAQLLQIEDGTEKSKSASNIMHMYEIPHILQRHGYAIAYKMRTATSIAADTSTEQMHQSFVHSAKQFTRR